MFPMAFSEQIKVFVAKICVVDGNILLSMKCDQESSH